MQVITYYILWVEYTKKMGFEKVKKGNQPLAGAKYLFSVPANRRQRQNTCSLSSPTVGRGKLLVLCPRQPSAEAKYLFSALANHL